MNDILTERNNQQLTTDYDLYANLLLSNLLDKEEETKEEQKEQDEEKPIDLTNDVIWVPADKHPQIAPIEFAKFIEVHGANTPVRRRSSSLQRRKSVLSQSHTFEDDEFRHNLQVSDESRDDMLFDRNSSSVDNSPILAHIPDKTLLRRSAFSARGRSRRSTAKTKRSTSERRPASSTADTWDKSEGVSLYDQPVNMSEWIDLGSASLESDDSSQRGILSRVHDAESQLRSQINNEQEEEQVKERESIEIKRPTMVRPPPILNTKSELIEKRPSWFTGLFHTKQGKLMNNLNNKQFSNLATLFTRSLKSQNNNTMATNATNKKKKPSRLEITSSTSSPTSIRPSATTTTTTTIAYNSNRLPLHVERAIYRLSHMKLADPKRPLRQQVLISNLMFWYLSIQQTILVQNYNNSSNANSMEDIYSVPPPQQQQRKVSKMSRIINAAKKRTQQPERHIQFEEDDLPLSHYKT
ncbi:Putative Potential regulator of cell polarity [Rhizopus microsporus]|nr:Putative Potential regulator of cell polarity [Rhizopus microsporus]